MSLNVYIHNWPLQPFSQDYSLVSHLLNEPQTLLQLKIQLNISGIIKTLFIQIVPGQGLLNLFA